MAGLLIMCPRGPRLGLLPGPKSGVTTDKRTALKKGSQPTGLTRATLILAPSRIVQPS